MTVKLFCHRKLEDITQQHGLNLTALKEDFRRYKELDIPATNFGRDAEYNHPNGPVLIREEKVAHIHLESPDSPWGSQIVQFNKTSDIHLVYCQGFYDSNYYLLMALLSPDAHAQALNNNIMRNLGLMAKTFREQY